MILKEAIYKWHNWRRWGGGIPNSNKKWQWAKWVFAKSHVTVKKIGSVWSKAYSRVQGCVPQGVRWYFLNGSLINLIQTMANLIETVSYVADKRPKQKTNRPIQTDHLFQTKSFLLDSSKALCIIAIICILRITIIKQRKKF